MNFLLKTILLTTGTIALVNCSSTTKTSKIVVPADKFDLSHWKITLPTDLNKDGKIDEIGVKNLQKFAHPHFFALNAKNEMVFTVPNKAITTANSSNTRSELRQMPRGKNMRIATNGAGNNFGVTSNKKAKIIGGKLNASLRVLHVSKRAGYAHKQPAYSVVVGQIHATKDKDIVAEGEGFGYGNEPIKIYYKKWPNHDTGSVFWNYERNLAKEDKNRTDIAYPIWGNLWDDKNAPGETGIALGEEFSYEINVHGNMMYLTFETANQKTVKYEINLADNVDAYGKVDSKDHVNGYTGDFLYFKAGAYNQCSTKDAPAFWYAACPGTGDWKTDRANGDFTSVAFTKLALSESTQP